MLSRSDMKVIKGLLSRHEGGAHGYLIDDATGRKITQGSAVIGHPTIGIGHNLDAKPLSPAVVSRILDEDIAEVLKTLDEVVPWYKDRSPSLISALVSWCFNMGPAGFKKCAPTLELIQAKKYAEAARRIEMFKVSRPGSPAGLRARYKEIANIVSPAPV